LFSERDSGAELKFSWLIGHGRENAEGGRIDPPSRSREMDGVVQVKRIGLKCQPYALDVRT
jgi:hypothetical protein